jgi:hypothetical protein
MSSLFDPARHEPLDAEPWSEAAARRAIARIAEHALDAFDGEGWPMHPLDDPESPDERQHGLYLGSGGVIVALDHLARAGAVARRHDFGPIVQSLLERNRAVMGVPQHGSDSFLFGDSGLLLLQWLMQPGEALARRLRASVRANLRNPALEQLWGSPGSLLAAVFMARATGAPEWGALLREGVQILWDQMEPVEAGGVSWFWTQDLYGRQEVLLGAGHGFAGNVYPALLGAPWLDAALVKGFADRALQTLQATAIRSGDLVNWPPALMRSEQPPKMLVQDCHGAPGVVCRLATAPHSAAWDALLTGAGELIWQAGPLAKGPSVCHGTAGSALAMLKLWRRSGDRIWLHRGRALAMHAAAQVERHRHRYGVGRHSLWTGDPGVACVLHAALTGSAEFPTLDTM